MNIEGGVGRFYYIMMYNFNNTNESGSQALLNLNNEDIQGRFLLLYFVVCNMIGLITCMTEHIN